MIKAHLPESPNIRMPDPAASVAMATARASGSLLTGISRIATWVGSGLTSRATHALAHPRPLHQDDHGDRERAGYHVEVEGGEGGQDRERNALRYVAHILDDLHIARAEGAGAAISR